MLPYLEKETKERMSQGGGDKTAGSQKIDYPIEDKGRQKVAYPDENKGKARAEKIKVWQKCHTRSKTRVKPVTKLPR